VELTALASPVLLTAHPLQRIGACALAALGGVDDPAKVTDVVFEAARARMVRDVGAAAEDTEGLASFWLSVSYMMWPNSPVNPTARGKQPVQERRDRISAWRDYPPDSLEVPCALCGRPGCGFYGKVDVPLGASTAHRNTTAPGHAGLPLCRACLAAFHALPYGCALGGGRAAALHSWDDDFLRKSVRRQVGRTTRQATAGQLAGGARVPYAREVAALRGLRDYEQRISEGVDLYVFSNSNRGQFLDVQSLSQPLANWLRDAIRDSGHRDGLQYLIRAHWTPTVPGSCLLARNAFREPARILARARGYLSGLAGEKGGPPAETVALAGLCVSFATEVLGVEERDMKQIQELGGRIAELLARDPQRGTVKKYEHVHRNSRDLQAWLRRNGVSWLTEAGQTQPLVTAEQWRLLFDPDARAWFYQDLLLISVLEALAADGRFAGAADASGERAERAERDDEELFTKEETGQ
jgi:hypothetical protein